MLPAWHLLGPRSLPLVPCWANSYVMLLHFGQLSEYNRAAEKSPNKNFEMVTDEAAFIWYQTWQSFRRIPQNHCWSNWSNMLINPPANIYLRLIYHIYAINQQICTTYWCTVNTLVCDTNILIFTWQLISICLHQAMCWWNMRHPVVGITLLRQCYDVKRWSNMLIHLADHRPSADPQN